MKKVRLIEQDIIKKLNGLSGEESMSIGLEAQEKTIDDLY